MTDLYLVNLCSSKKMSQHVLNVNSHLDDKIGVMCTYAMQKIVDKTINYGFEKIILDSGAFSAYQSGYEINIDDLADFIKEREKYLVASVNLDVISDLLGFESRKNWLYLRDKKGIETIPVFHFGEDWDILEFYCKESEYICLGGVTGLSLRSDNLMPFLDRAWRDYPDKNFHLLGINNLDVLKRYDFYSCDSLSWRSGSRFGQIITPHGRWWISKRNSRAVSEYDVSRASLDKWLDEYGIPYPIPEKFDYELLDMVNIRILYEEISIKNNHVPLSFNASLF